MWFNDEYGYEHESTFNANPHSLQFSWYMTFAYTMFNVE